MTEEDKNQEAEKNGFDSDDLAQPEEDEIDQLDSAEDTDSQDSIDQTDETNKLEEADEDPYGWIDQSATAMFNFKTNSHTYSPIFFYRTLPFIGKEFLKCEEMSEEEGDKRLRKILRPGQGHEIGHYKYFPATLGDWLYLLAYGEQQFEGKGIPITRIYGEIPNELSILKDNVLGKGDNGIVELRRAMIRMEQAENRDPIIQKIFVGIYQNYFDEEGWKNPETRWVEVDEKEKEMIDKLAQIGYLPNPPAGRDPVDFHRANIIRFGSVIKHLIPEAPKSRRAEKKLDEEFIYKMEGMIEKMQGMLNEDWEELEENYNHPPINPPVASFVRKSDEGGYGIGTADPFGDLKEIPEGAIDEALREVIRKHGRKAYRRVKKFAEKHGNFRDTLKAEPKDRQPVAGLDGAEFEWNDDEVDFYKRWASNYGVFIYKKEAVVDTTSTYRCGKKEFEPGDPVQKIDPFASRGLIGVPGVSKVHTEDSGVQTARKLIVPGLNLILDTSGSMTHPKNKSYPVLSVFVLGRNYERNGSMVGGINISVDMAYIPLSYELDEFYSLMCGYWGGGTYFNTEKLKAAMEKMTDKGQMQKIIFEEIDIDRLIHTLPQEILEQAKEKKIEPDLSKLKERYEKVDNVLITDGYIWNIEEVVGYLNQMARVTRNFIFISNQEQYKVWSDMELPNTQVLLAEKEEDFVGLALGRSRAFAGEVRQAYRSGVFK